MVPYAFSWIWNSPNLRSVNTNFNAFRCKEVWEDLGSQNVVVKGAMELGAWFGGFGLFSPWSLINGGYGAWGTHYTRTSWCCCLVQCFWWPSEWHLCEIKPRNSQDMIHFVCQDLQSAESSVQDFCKVTFQVLKSSKFSPQWYSDIKSSHTFGTNSGKYDNSVDYFCW